MSRTAKKQIGFYADPDIEEYLDTLEGGVKTRTINAALRAWKESRTSIEPTAAVYEDKLDSLVAWLNGMRPQITVSNQANEVLSLGALLELFLTQERQRPSDKSWSQIVAEGSTFEASMHRCASCHRSLLVSETINTPSRGPLCRQCFELPRPRARSIEDSPDIERYANDDAHFWIRYHDDEVTSEFSQSRYADLPRYIQKVIDSEQYHRVVSRCFARITKKLR